MKKQLTIAIDLDNTICTSIRRNHPEDIMRVKPFKNKTRIYRELLQGLRKEGYKIIIFTSRDFCGKNAKELTIRWLDKYEIPYDRLLANKPHYDLFIGDRVLSIMSTSNWTVGYIKSKLRASKESIRKHTYKPRK